MCRSVLRKEMAAERTVRELKGEMGVDALSSIGV